LVELYEEEPWEELEEDEENPSKMKRKRTYWN